MNINTYTKIQVSGVPEKFKTPEENLASAVILNAVYDLKKSFEIMSKKRPSKVMPAEWRLKIKEAEMNYSYAKNFLLGKYEISEFWFNLAGLRNYFTVSDVNKTLATYMGQL